MKTTQISNSTDLYHINKETLKLELFNIIIRAYKNDGNFSPKETELGYLADETAELLKFKYQRLFFGDIQKAFDMGQNGDFDSRPNSKNTTNRQTLKFKNISYWFQCLIEDRNSSSLRIRDNEHENNKKRDDLTEGIAKGNKSKSPITRGTIFKIKLSFEEESDEFTNWIDSEEAGKLIIEWENEEKEKRELSIKQRKNMRYRLNEIDTVFVKAREYYKNKFNQMNNF